MFYFRINKIKVKDNRTAAFLFFKRDLADVKIISIVTSGNDDLPNLDAWMNESDPAKKETLLAAAVSKVVASRILTEIDDIKDNQSLTFGDTGYVLYQSKTIPDDFNWCLVAVKSARSKKQLGELMAGVVKDPEFDTFSKKLATLVAEAANPVFSAGVAVARFATGIIAKILETAGDQQLGILYMSLDRAENYPHGERKKDDVPDLSGNLLIDYSVFAFE